MSLSLPAWSLQAASVFVKNLSFATTEQELRSHFSSQLGDAAVRSAVVSLSLMLFRPRHQHEAW